MIQFNAFVACSFDEKDELVRKNYEELLRNMGFKPDVRDIRTDNGRLSDEIIEAIKSNDVFVAILTQRDGNIPSWLSFETAFAYSSKKSDKIFVLYEDVLKDKLSGVFEDIKSKAIFKRNDLRSFNVVNRLQIFREKLISQMYVPLYQFDEVIAYRELINQECYILASQKTVRVIGNNKLYELKHKTNRVSSDDSVDMSIDDKDFVFDGEVYSKKNKQIYGDIIRNDACAFQISVKFPEGLEKEEDNKSDEFAKYYFKLKRKNYKKFIKEEVDNSESYWKFLQDEQKEGNFFQRTNHYIVYPTKKLKLIVKFPKNYPVEKYKAIALIHDTTNVNEEETDRLYIKKVEEFGQITLILEVDFPKINHSYHLCWEPPTRDKLIQRGFELKGENK